MIFTDNVRELGKIQYPDCRVNCCLYIVTKNTLLKFMKNGCILNKNMGMHFYYYQCIPNFIPTSLHLREFIIPFI